MSSTTIAAQVDEFNEGFIAQIGPDLSDVFAREQSALIEAGVPAGAVAVGDRLPSATLRTATGDDIGLSDVLGGRPAVLVFYRGSWCPYCNLALKTYQRELLPALREKGIELVAISPQTPTASDQIVTAGELTFTVLTDPGNALSDELGLLTEPTADARKAHTALGFDVADSNADQTGNIPFPTVLVVDAAGEVVFADVHVDYTTRTEVETILAAVAGLG